jgi:preprotein translocase subunit YajC
MWTDAYAQAPTATTPGPPDPTAAFLFQYGPLILIFLIIYFLMIRPQQQRQRQTRDMLGTLKKGDRVLTTAGIYGTVVGVDEAKAVLKIADDVRVEFAKSAIVQVVAEDAKG